MLGKCICVNQLYRPHMCVFVCSYNNINTFRRWSVSRVWPLEEDFGGKLWCKDEIEKAWDGAPFLAFLWALCPQSFWPQPCSFDYLDIQHSYVYDYLFQFRRSQYWPQKNLHFNIAAQCHCRLLVDIYGMLNLELLICSKSNTCNSHVCLPIGGNSRESHEKMGKIQFRHSYICCMNNVVHFFCGVNFVVSLIFSNCYYQATSMFYLMYQ